jgi:hypothetical protein
MTATAQLIGDEDTGWLLGQALALASLGYQLIPVRVTIDVATGQKRPHFVVDWQRSAAAADVMAWHEEHAPNVWAVHCGSSGVDVVDQDVKPGVDGPANARAAGVPESVMTTCTPSGGRHDWFAPLGDGLGTHAGVLPGVDTRGVGGVVFAVGVLPDGRRWTVTGARAPTRLPSYPSEVMGALRPLRASGTGARAVRAHDDPFAAPEQGRSFTDAGAVEWFDRCLAEFRDSARGRKYNATRLLAHQLSVLEQAWPGRVDACWKACREVLAELDAHPVMPDRVGSWADAERAFRGAWDYGTQNFPQAERIVITESPSQEGPADAGEVTGLRVLSLGDLREMPGVRSLIKGVLSRNVVAMLVGMNQTFKSFVALDWAFSVANGRAWFGRRIRAAEPVLYIAAEGAEGVRRRLLAWERHHDVTVGENFHLIPMPVQFKSALAQAWLLEQVERIRPALVVIDTVHQSAGGLDENDSGDMSVVMVGARKLTRHGATVLLVHHTGHAGERARGSSSFGDDADEVWVIRRDDDATPGLDTVRTMHHNKAKDGALGLEIELRPQVILTGLEDEDGDPVTSLVVEPVMDGDGDVDVVWGSHAHACTLLQLGLVAKGASYRALGEHLVVNHGDVAFRATSKRWLSALQAHYRECNAIHSQYIKSDPVDHEKQGDPVDHGVTGH